jgi:glutathione S-transferase
MIEFHAGSGPDTQAIGIALEEMYLTYTIAPRLSPVPLTVVGNARLPGANNVLMALARKTGHFLPDAEQAAPWLSKTPPGLDELEARLSDRDFIFSVYTIADMAMYPLVAKRSEDLAAFPKIARWAERLRLRPEVGRGMVAVFR